MKSDIHYRFRNILPTAADGVRADARSCGICGKQSGIGHVISLLRFPLANLMPPTAPYSLIILLLDAT
jgi:hypothetical protein